MVDIIGKLESVFNMWDWRAHVITVNNIYHINNFLSQYTRDLPGLKNLGVQGTKSSPTEMNLLPLEYCKAFDCVFYFLMLTYVN